METISLVVKPFGVVRNEGPKLVRDDEAGDGGRLDCQRSKVTSDIESRIVLRWNKLSLTPTATL